MAKILKTDQAYVMGHIVEVLHELDDKLDANVDVANNAQAMGSDAITIANAANTNASTAQATAQNATSRLAGDNDYFIGAWPLTNTADTDNLPSTMVDEGSQGITWDNTNKKFNFSYLGWYAITIETGGDILNTRTDWYQEFSVLIKQNSVIQQRVDLNIPPTMTKNIRTHFTGLIKVELGDIIQVFTRHQTGGMLQSPVNGYIRIKKVI
jgi:hypothetical protein